MWLENGDEFIYDRFEFGYADSCPINVVAHTYPQPRNLSILHITFKKKLGFYSTNRSHVLCLQVEFFPISRTPKYSVAVVKRPRPKTQRGKWVD